MEKINLMVLRKIGKMKLRMVGISFVVAMAVAMLICGLYSADVFDYSTETMLADSKMPDIFVEFSEPVNRSDIEPKLIAQGLRTFDMRLNVWAFYTYKGETYSAFVIGMEDPGRQDINVMTVDSGKLFEEPGEGVVIAGMETYGAHTGEAGTFLISGKEVEINITGVVKNAEYALAGYMAETSVPVPGNVVALYMGLADLQEILNVSGVNDLVLIMEEGQDHEVIVDSLETLQIKSVTLQKDHFTVTFMKMGADKMNYMMPLVSVIFMIVGFISIMMTSYRLVLNDSRFIGVLMSLGYSRGRIVRSYLLLGMVLAGVGLFFGIILSFLLTYAITSVTMEMIGSIEIAFPFSPMPFVLGALYTVGAVLFSVAIPVILITRFTVREALDYKPRSKITTLKYGPSFLSRTTLMGLRNITRNPARLGITVLVVGMTIGMAGSWLIMMDSAWGYIRNNVDSQTWDMRADFFEPVAIESVIDLDPFLSNDTEYVIPYTGIGGSVSYKTKSTGAVFMGCDDMERVRDFQVMKGKVDLDRAVITNTVADELDVGVGDKVHLKVGSISKELTVSAVVNDIVQSAVYTDRDAIAVFFPPKNCTGVYVKLKDPENTEDHARELRLKPAVTKVAVKDQVVKSFDDLLDQANQMLYFFFFISAIITFVVSGSAVIISTMERDIEFATLNTLGISKWQVAKSLLVEMAVLGLLAGVVGVPLAYLFAEIFAIVMAKILFTYPVVFIMGATIITFISGVAFVLLSATIPIRYSGKVDTEKTLRERTAG